MLVVGACALALAGACSDGDDGDDGANREAAVTTSSSSPTSSSTGATGAAASTQLAAKAGAVVDLVVENKWAALRNDFDDNLRGALSEVQLAEAWKKMTDRFGAYKSHAEPAQLPSQGDGLETFDALLTFANGQAKARITFDAQGKIAGLFFLDKNAS